MTTAWLLEPLWISQKGCSEHNLSPLAIIQMQGLAEAPATRSNPSIQKVVRWICAWMNRHGSASLRSGSPTNSSQSDNPDMELVIFTIRFWMHQNLGKNFLNIDYHFSWLLFDKHHLLFSHHSSWSDQPISFHFFRKISLHDHFHFLHWDI